MNDTSNDDNMNIDNDKAKDNDAEMEDASNKDKTDDDEQKESEKEEDSIEDFPDDFDKDEQYMIEPTDVAIVKRHVLKFQFKHSKTKSLPTSRGHIAQMTTKIVNYIIDCQELSANVLTANKEKVDKQSVQTFPDEKALEMFCVQFCPNATRQHEMWLQIDSTKTFAQLKASLMAWL